MSKNIPASKNQENQYHPDRLIVDLSFPSISIVTPSYNQNKYLETSINSVLLQGYPNLEYIVVDDCSTDDSVMTLKKYKNRLIFLQNRLNRGQAYALNHGFYKSSGEIMGTINGDDVYLPYTLHLVGKIFQQFPEIDWITGHPSFLVDGDAISPRRHHLDAYNSKLMQLGFYTPWLMGVPQHISTFFRRNLYEKAGGIIKTNLRDSLDIDLWIRMSNYSAPVFVPVTLAMMRLHDDQRSAQEKHSELAFKEIEDQDYGFIPLRLRKFIKWGMKHYGLRGVIRHFLFDGKAKRLNWNSKTNTWEILDCYAF